MHDLEIVDPSDAAVTHTYRLRSLATTSSALGSRPYDEAYEIKRWAEFCAACFSYKPNPPPAEYFARHYYNDPQRDASLVKVIEWKNPTTNEWEIAASTKVFQRIISTGRNSAGQSIVAGGIGEVCTSDQHRRRSLSKMLLLDAIGSMEAMGMEASLLHASPALQAVYERGGNYKAVRSRWTVVKVTVGELNKVGSDLSGYRIRLASFPEDTASLSAIHRRFSESKFAGCICRSDNYWSNYVSKEIGDSLYVLTKDNAIIGCLSVRVRGDRIQLREFSVDPQHCGVQDAICLLLKEAVTCDEESFRLHLPASILGDDVRTSTSGPFEFVTEDDDVGWMYRPIQSEKRQGHDMVKYLAENSEVDHLVWPTDSF
mmetsp:Transcript_26566/g.76723  ORF Transcript_26566/g.76723 Transcript_26566/m.76723 type:complete len:372 (-) Transcript_26566:1240-2355(-)